MSSNVAGKFSHETEVSSWERHQAKSWNLIGFSITSSYNIFPMDPNTWEGTFSAMPETPPKKVQLDPLGFLSEGIQVLLTPMVGLVSRTRNQSGNFHDINHSHVLCLENKKTGTVKPLLRTYCNKKIRGWIAGFNPFCRLLVVRTRGSPVFLATGSYPPKQELINQTMVFDSYFPQVPRKIQADDNHSTQEASKFPAPRGNRTPKRKAEVNTLPAPPVRLTGRHLA